MADFEWIVRPATEADVPGIVAIYNHEVVHGTSHYETRLQTEAERLEWLRRLKAMEYPILVATAPGERVLGFGALTPFHPVSGYRFTATGSLYVSPDCRGAGIGRAIGAVLVEEARRRGLRTIVAGINARNTASIRLHESFGFRQVGYFREIGHKNGCWHDDVCLQLHL